MSLQKKRFKRAFRVPLLRLLISLYAISAPVLAVEVKGFGTLGVAYNENDGAGFVRDGTQPVGIKGSASLKTDSRLGLQLDAPLTANIKSTIQAVSKYNAKGNFTPSISLAFLKYSATPAATFRLGRVGWDVIPYSSSRDVGYSYTWVRPPSEFFGKVQFDSIDGGDLTYVKKLGGVVLTTKVFGGITTETIALDKDGDIDHESKIWGSNIDLSYGGWLHRISYSHLAIDVDYNRSAKLQLQAFYNSEDPSLNHLAGFVDLNGKSADLVSFYSSYERGPATFEALLGHTESSIPTFHTLFDGFFSISYRINQITPFIRYSFSTPLNSPSIPQPILNKIKDFNISEHQQTLSVGARYDFAKNIAAKWQIDRVNVADNGRSAFLWREVEADWNGNAILLSFSLDFVF